MSDARPTAVVYETGKVRYRGVYMDGVYTRRMALAIKQEAENILKFFDKTDAGCREGGVEMSILDTQPGVTLVTDVVARHEKEIQELKRLVTPMMEFKRREWASLTDDEIKDIVGRNDPGGIGLYTREMFKKIEDKLKEKNT